MKTPIKYWIILALSILACRKPDPIPGPTSPPPDLRIEVTSSGPWTNLTLTQGTDTELIGITNKKWAGEWTLDLTDTLRITTSSTGENTHLHTRIIIQGRLVDEADSTGNDPILVQTWPKPE